MGYVSSKNIQHCRAFRLLPLQSRKMFPTCSHTHRHSHSKKLNINFKREKLGHNCISFFICRWCTSHLIIISNLLLLLLLSLLKVFAGLSRTGALKAVGAVTGGCGLASGTLHKLWHRVSFVFFCRVSVHLMTTTQTFYWPFSCLSRTLAWLGAGPATRSLPTKPLLAPLAPPCLLGLSRGLLV